MLFSSLSFIFAFLPAVVLVYFSLRSRRARNVFLLLASLFFYAWGEPWFVLVMIASILVNWACGLWIDRQRKRTSSIRPAVIAASIFNLSLLFVFKYLNFTLDSLTVLTQLSFHLPRLQLPIGISFFTFQAFSYVLDVAMERADVQKNPLWVGLYVSFFPQLIAGPIVRYQTIAAEIDERQENWQDFSSGLERFLVGLVKKVLLANTLGVLADRVFDYDPAIMAASYAWLGILVYSLQIFYDFSGYSDMAIGMGRMFGFHFDENFDLPYMSCSISEFWRRWHISLGTWFRDYVYFPLGGSRVGTKTRLVFNLAVVWFLTGLWHGANWTFILWGIYYLFFLVAEKLSGMDTHSRNGLQLPRRLYTLLIVMIGWVIFRSDSVSYALGYIGAMFGLNGIPFFNDLSLVNLRENSVILAAALLFCMPAEKFLSDWSRQHRGMTAAVEALGLSALFMLAIACIVKGSYNPFIYFNF